jgi:hypothetical protein
MKSRIRVEDMPEEWQRRYRAAHANLLAARAEKTRVKK